ncbi:sensor histidine kinase [Pelagovum pacificum]|uniref:histidine kinase n=1 Tax=Pelagovum pacificum TaxID=2588711 RepID=A0A5C5GCU7_9RHOB|nr:HAMP domain-containing sensor histidine kinase [Pelagovum pacificum]QQA44246.1 HAMP domain-containing histidine kinase [Pelagovum pacificum]TNY32632.1 HAMP domain-containing histidine kinase [Pelagovum pacificum]
MKLYEYMAGKSWPRSYNGKILLVSFLGVHVPMFGAVSYVLLADTTPLMEQLDVLGAMLVATLIGTAATMFVMHTLLAPVRAASRAADAYLKRRETPRLPTNYTDEAGVLMASVQECITRLDSSLASTEYQIQQLEQDHAEKFRMVSGMKHDFRTPLTHILGFASLMKSESIGPLGNQKYQTFVSKIGTSGEQLLQTLNSLIDLSDTQSAAQIAEDSEDLDLVALASDAVNLEHLHAEKTGVTVTLHGPEALTAHTVRSAAKTLLATTLHAAISVTPQGGHVAFRLTRDADGISISATSSEGVLSLEDVPPRLAHHFDQLESGTGARSANAETATPVTLRLSLIDTLSRVIGARFTMQQSRADGVTLKTAIPEVLTTEMPLAA